MKIDWEMSRDQHTQLHSHLLGLMKILPEDYEGYGDEPRTGPDCSCGCVYYIPLLGALASDWGVCSNPDSHRCGLLTFEHQGCLKWARDEGSPPAGLVSLHEAMEVRP